MMFILTKGEHTAITADEETKNVFLKHGFKLKEDKKESKKEKEEQKK